MPAPEIIIGQTSKWITDVVMGYNFCPFAARAVNSSSVRYRVVDSEEKDQQLQAFLDECVWLDEHPETETSLLILPGLYNGFMDYLELVELAEELLEQEGYEGIYQVASFHPNYQFEGAPTDDPANYTNRSPYPMLHLLREESIEKALDHYAGDADAIPERNISFARQKGLAFWKQLLESFR